MKQFHKNRNRGFTLIELLVAISVLTIVIALVVPRLRIANKERNIRETARLIGATISSARDRAVNDGSGGFIIQRNLNFVSNTGDGNRVYYAGTRLVELRATPPYVGDSVGATANVTLMGNAPDFFLRCMIEVPDEHDDNGSRKVVRPNDIISFGSNATYRISEVLDVNSGMLPLNLTFEVATTDENPAEADLTIPDRISGFLTPPLNENLPFEITRQPRRIQHSSVDLPAGYIIDMRYSGPLDGGATETVNPDIGTDDLDTYTFFGTALADVDNDLNDPEANFNQEVVVLFDSQGAIDTVFSTIGESVIPVDSVNLFVTEYDPSEIAIGETPIDATSRDLSNPDSLWVTVGTNGGVNVSYNTPPIGNGLTGPELINASRSSTLNRVSAIQ